MKKYEMVKVVCCRGSYDMDKEVCEGELIDVIEEKMDKEECEYYLNWSDGGSRVWDEVKGKVKEKGYMVFDGEEGVVLFGNVEDKEYIEKKKMICAGFIDWEMEREEEWWEKL